MRDKQQQRKQRKQVQRKAARQRIGLWGPETRRRMETELKMLAHQLGKHDLDRRVRKRLQGQANIVMREMEADRAAMHHDRSL